MDGNSTKIEVKLDEAFISSMPISKNDGEYTWMGHKVTRYYYDGRKKTNESWNLKFKYSKG